ncbi:uncharacterized protein LOC134815251 isoform X2 [Bolinopsis microptera]|uniref:uncharacterized protein LOC134815251 isoform X2 n=1 Tax=Bolinopsis microptera TaxID=2820187 RepID=UPI003079A45D
MESERVRGLVQQMEDVADRVIAKIAPHARSLAKFGILFLHFQIAFLTLIEFENISLFIGYSLNLNDKVKATIDPETGKKTFAKNGANNISMFLALLLVVTRLGSLTYIYLKKHVVPAVTVLAIPSFISVTLHFNERIGLSSIFSISTFLSQIGCLLMVAAESLEDKDMHLVGIPSWGVNKRIDILSLFSRINIVLVVIGIQTQYAIFLSGGDASRFFIWFLMLIMLPMILCVVAGYKTKVISVALAVMLTLFSLYCFPFFLHLAEGNYFMFYTLCFMFGINLSGVGSLIYIAILGAGTYSVDHMKRQ